MNEESKKKIQKSLDVMQQLVLISKDDLQQEDLEGLKGSLLAINAQCLRIVDVLEKEA